MIVELDVLRKGSKGNVVKTLQRLLKSYGHKGKNGLDLVIDGDLGSNSEYALRLFQKSAGLSVDGICGKNTWNKLLIGK